MCPGWCPNRLPRLVVGGLELRMKPDNLLGRVLGELRQ